MTVTARITISDTDTPTPYIDPATGEWMVYDASKGDYVSTGVRAKGQKGDGLEVDDSHFNEDLPPSWYQEHHPMSTVRESKSVGVLNVTRMGFQENCLLETITNYDVVTQHAILGDAEGVTLYRRDEPKSNFARWLPWSSVSAEVKELERGLSSAKTSISALQQAKEEIERGKLNIDDLPKNLKWIYDAFHDGKTEIEGGLMLSKFIGLSNSSDKTTSYISGQDGPGAHMLAAGVSSLTDQNATSYINYDGSAKFGNLRISKSGVVWSYSGGTPVKGEIIPVFTNWGLDFIRYPNGTLVDSIHHNGGDIFITGCTIKHAKIYRFDDRVMPRVLAHGKFDISGSLSRAIAYDSHINDILDDRFSCQRTREGAYKLTFPAEWVSNYNLVFQGTEQDSLPEHTARFVSFGQPKQEGGVGYVYVFGADDNTLNDVAVYFQIIAL